MNKQQEIKLSSSWTSVGVYGGALLVLLLFPVLLLAIKEQKFHAGMIFGVLMYFALVGLVIYQFMYVCDARVINDKLILKKKFRPAKSYSFDHVGELSSFRIKNSKYTTVEMTNDNYTLEKYLILNSNSLLAFEHKDAEQTLKLLRSYKL